MHINAVGVSCFVVGRGGGGGGNGGKGGAISGGQDVTTNDSSSLKDCGGTIKKNGTYTCIMLLS
jgi:hypothetical protein